MSNESIVEEAPPVDPGQAQVLPSEEPSITTAEPNPSTSLRRDTSPAHPESVPTSEHVPIAPRSHRFRVFLQKFLTIFDDSRANRAVMMSLVLLGIFFPLYYSSTTPSFAMNRFEDRVFEHKVAKHFYLHRLLRGRLKFIGLEIQTCWQEGS